MEKIIELKDYRVILQPHSIQYQTKDKKWTVPISSHFDIEWDDEVRMIDIKFRDRWGCEMHFLYYEPADIKGMFDFIGNGYGVLPEILKMQTFRWKAGHFLAGMLRAFTNSWAWR